MDGAVELSRIRQVGDCRSRVEAVQDALFPLRDERVSRGEAGEKIRGLAMNFLSMLFSKNLSRILKKVAAVNRLSEPA